MSKRLQVLMDESELRSVRRSARRNRVTVAEWVRQAIRAAQRETPSTAPNAKLAVIAAASSSAFPTAGIERMIEEIEAGYRAGGAPASEMARFDGATHGDVPPRDP